MNNKNSELTYLLIDKIESDWLEYKICATYYFDEYSLGYSWFIKRSGEIYDSEQNKMLYFVDDCFKIPVGLSIADLLSMLRQIRPRWKGQYLNFSSDSCLAGHKLRL